MSLQAQSQQIKSEKNVCISHSQSQLYELCDQNQFRKVTKLRLPAFGPFLFFFCFFFNMLHRCERSKNVYCFCYCVQNNLVYELISLVLSVDKADYMDL